MEKRLNVAFVWHMHQPLYKDPLNGEYTLPWVLFHATKDYYDMAAILEEFPQVHQTFNLVPCLIEQINEYASGKAKDRYRRIAMLPAAKLTTDEKVFMLQFFFQANWDNMIRPIPRYWDLLRKRGISNEKDEMYQVLRYFTEQDYLDLQVLYNLIWIDPSIREKDLFLKGLYEKGGGYTEDEKALLLRKQTAIVGTIIPKYAELKKKGIIEVSTTPYYHPILPLLCDSDSAKEAMPGATLPRERFQHPEDALTQIRRGLALFKETFGERARGRWPSEGSVSMDMLPLVSGEGVEWIATDEEILSNSLKRPIRRDQMGNCYDPFLYKPYEIDVNGRKITIVFRDHVLSDLIGFDYSRMDPEHAASDMVTRLNHIRNMVESPEEHLVSIILDGENASELFRNEKSLTGTPEYELKKEAIREAWEEVYASEGSDWFWWYGEEHSSMSDEDFDSLFRKHIKRIYQLIEREPPDYLDIPISSDIKSYRPPSEPRAAIKPVVDGMVSNYFEWLSSGRLERTYFGSAMHKEIQGGLINSISYGFSSDALYMRFDYLEELGLFTGPWNFTVNFVHPKQVRVAAEIEGSSSSAEAFTKTSEKERWAHSGPLEIASDNVVELAIPFTVLGAVKGEEMKLYITINGRERGVERWPVKGYLLFAVPPEDFEQQDWIV